MPLLLLALMAGRPASADVPTPQPVPPSGQEPGGEPESGPQPGPAAEPIVLIEGQITNMLGSGLEGIVVTVNRQIAGKEHGELIATTATDEMGDFTVMVAGPVSGEFLVTMTKDLYRPITVELHLDEENIPAFIGEEMSGSLALAGRVLDFRTGEAIAGADAVLTAGFREYSAKSDEQGKFSIEELSPCQALLRVESQGYGREQVPVYLSAGMGMLSVPLKPERVVHIQLADDLGKPIPGVTVDCYDPPRDDFRSVVSDNAGTATLRGLHFDATTLSLRVTHENYASSADFDEQIILPQSEAESTHKLVMQRAGSITGSVADAATGRPLNGARVTVGEAAADLSSRGWADHEGKYTVFSVRPGLRVVTVHLSDYAPGLATVEVQPEKAANLDFKLATPMDLTGVVRHKNGEPAMGAWIETGRWRDHYTLDLRAIADREGKFVIANVPAEEFEVIVYDERGSRLNRTVNPAVEASLTIELPDTPGPVAAATAVKTGQEAPDVKLTTLGGESLEISALKGKVVVLDFWATWCAPCVAEVPELVRIHKTWGGRKDFIMISVSLDFDEAALKKFIDSNAMTWHHVAGDAGGAVKAADGYGVAAIPAVFVIDAEGRVVAANARAPQVEEYLKTIFKNGGGS